MIVTGQLEALFTNQLLKPLNRWRKNAKNAGKNSSKAKYLAIGLVQVKKKCAISHVINEEIKVGEAVKEKSKCVIQQDRANVYFWLFQSKNGAKIYFNFIIHIFY